MIINILKRKKHSRNIINITKEEYEKEKGDLDDNPYAPKPISFEEAKEEWDTMQTTLSMAQTLLGMKTIDKKDIISFEDFILNYTPSFPNQLIDNIALESKSKPTKSKSTPKKKTTKKTTVAEDTTMNGTTETQAIEGLDDLVMTELSKVMDREDKEFQNNKHIIINELVNDNGLFWDIIREFSPKEKQDSIIDAIQEIIKERKDCK